MAGVQAEENVIDRGRIEQLRGLSARKPNRALVKAKANIMQAKSRALREERLNEKHEKYEQRQYQSQASKIAERQDRAERLEERLTHQSKRLANRQQALEQKAIRDLERHAAKDEAIQNNKVIERTMREVMAKERDEKSGQVRSLVDSMVEKRREALIAAHAQEDERYEAFKEDLANVRNRATEMGRERAAAKSEDVALYKQRLERVRDEKEAAWFEKLERVTQKQYAQRIAQQEIRRHNLEIDFKVDQLNQLAERLTTPGGIANKQMWGQYYALQKELQDMSDAVPSSVADLAGSGSFMLDDPGLPKYMQSRPQSAGSSGPYASDAGKPDDDVYSPGNASTRAPTSAPGSPKIGKRTMPGQ